MSISNDQLPEKYRDIIEEQISVYNEGRSITVVSEIPDTTEIPIENPKHWLRIPNVICIFVDMMASTRLSAENHDKTTAGAYQLFTGTAVKLFSAFEAPYIDVRGDGVFALFDSSQPNRALAAAVTFKTFTYEECIPRIKKATSIDKIGCHIGIDMKTVLVRKIGFKRYRGRSDRQNEVWAGRPVNMAAKLASIAKDNELLASERYFRTLRSEFVLKSCGCSGDFFTGEKGNLWSEKDLEDDDRFDFDSAYSLRSCWCSRHGNEYCENILTLDD